MIENNVKNYISNPSVADYLIEPARWCTRHICHLLINLENKGWYVTARATALVGALVLFPLWNIIGSIALSGCAWKYFCPATSDQRAHSILPEVVKQPADGNCWLHATLYGLSQLKKTGSQTPQSLRAEVVDWIRKTYYNETPSTEKQTLHGYLHGTENNPEGAIQNQKRVQEIKLTEEQSSYHRAKKNLEAKAQTIWELKLEEKKELLKTFNQETYFAYINQDHAFGSLPELYAISQIFQVTIVIWRNVGGKLSREFDLPIEYPNSTEAIHIVMNQTGNHFDALIPEPTSL